MISRATLLAAFAFAALPVAGVARIPVSLCLRGETPVFSCAIETRRVAVCGDGRHAIYRFGRPGRIELQIRGGSVAMRSYSGGGETQLGFARRGYRYVVYDRTVRTAFGADGRHDPASTAGLLISHAGRLLSKRECREPGAALDVAAIPPLPTGKFLEH